MSSDAEQANLNWKAHFQLQAEKRVLMLYCTCSLDNAGLCLLGLTNVKGSTREQVLPLISLAKAYEDTEVNNSFWFILW